MMSLVRAPKTMVPGSFVKAFRRRALRATAGGCLEWPGATSCGYGAVSLGIGLFYAHRVAYFIAQGSLTPGTQIRHLCGNRICCNVDHLVEGTARENAADRERAKRGELVGPFG